MSMRRRPGRCAKTDPDAAWRPCSRCWPRRSATSPSWCSRSCRTRRRKLLDQLAVPADRRDFAALATAAGAGHDAAQARKASSRASSRRPSRRDAGRQPLPSRLTPTLATSEPEILARARRAGRRDACSPSAPSSTSSPAVRAIAERDADVWCSVGVHPHEAASEADPGVAGLVVGCAHHPKVVGIGETGLDFYYEHSPRAAAGRALPRPLRGGARDRPAADRPHPRRRSRDGHDPGRGSKAAHRRHPLLQHRARNWRNRRWHSAFTSRSRASSPSRPPRRCGRSRATCRSTGCWSRPTRPTSRRCRSAARPTSRPSSSTPRRCWPSSRASRSPSSPGDHARISSGSSPKPAGPRLFRARNDAGLRPVRGRAAHRRRMGRLRSEQPAQPAPALLDPGGGGECADPRRHLARHARAAARCRRRRARRRAAHPCACRSSARHRRSAHGQPADGTRDPALRGCDDDGRGRAALRLYLRADQSGGARQLLQAGARAPHHRRAVRRRRHRGDAVRARITASRRRRVSASAALAIRRM